MIDPVWEGLLREQQASRFEDLTGTVLTLTVPVSDRLVTRLAARHLPPSVPVSEIVVRAGDANTFAVRLRVSRSAWVPQVSLRFVITRQPQLPGTPVVVFTIVRHGLSAMAAPLLRFFDALPSWLTVSGDELALDLAALLARAGRPDLLAYLTDIELTTQPGLFLIHLRAGLPPRLG